MTPTAVLTAVMMVAASVGSWILAPRPQPAPAATLAEVVPRQFGDWKEVDSPIAPVNPAIAREPGRDMDRPYDDLLMRTYVNARGDLVLLALAYGRDQRQEVKIHRPELCYEAQGFRVLRRWSGAFAIPASPDGARGGARMLVQAPGRTEAVSYWIRIGTLYSESPWDTRYFILKEGLRRRSPDGMLVRVSQLIEGPQDASEARFALQEAFIRQLIAAMPEAGRRYLIRG